MGWTFDDETQEAEAELLALMESASSQSAARVLARAKVPVFTGKLKKSGHVTPSRSEGGHTAAGVEYDADYASAVHDGHMNPNGRFVAGRPFLTNALNEDEPNLDNDIAAGLEKLGCSRVDRF